MTLEELNSISPEYAQAEFLKCCGSTRWAQAMTQNRPFDSFETVLATADETWWSLGTEDWLEAFRAHPKIGEQKAAAAQSEQARAWSAQEQSAVANAGAQAIAQLAERNREYEDRFGFIFIVCASGKSSEEMLSMLNSRMHNDRETELQVAAEEQRKITRLRMEKLLPASL
jgi:OHCU decarboxylase